MSVSCVPISTALFANTTWFSLDLRKRCCTDVHVLRDLINFSQSCSNSTESSLKYTAADMTDDTSSIEQLAVFDYLKKNVSDKVASLFRKSTGLKGTAELPDGSPTITDVFKHYQQTTPKRKAEADDSTPKSKKVCKPHHARFSTIIFKLTCNMQPEQKCC